MKCPKCGSINHYDARFCTSCGTTLDETRDTQQPVSRRYEEQICFGLSGGSLPGLVIGIIIIIVGVTSVFGQSFGEIMGNWGANFGESMGRWGEGVGRFFARWGTSWGSKIGASITIIIGLAILYYVLYGQKRISNI